MNLNGMSNKGAKHMLPTEIERKFMIKYLPKEIENIKIITQKHIFKDDICSIRVRKTEDVFNKKTIYTHTIKARSEKVQKYSIYEIENKIKKQEYERIYPFKGSRIIKKYRCIVPIHDNLKVEVDVFDGWMKGLVIAEVEFKNVNQADNFRMPKWFEKSVSHREFSNRRLSTKTRKEILEMIDSRQLRNNKKIFWQIQNIIRSQN